MKNIILRFAECECNGNLLRIQSYPAKRVFFYGKYGDKDYSPITNKKFMKTNKNNLKYEFSIFRPGGNDTLLIKGILRKTLRKSINDTAMSKYPNIEQVGFYSYSNNAKLGRLEMAGGEFCGNALRSLAYLILDGKKGDLQFKVSGVNRILKAGVNKSNSAFAQIPILVNSPNVKKLKDNLWIVDLEGISHLITLSSKELGENEAKKIAQKLLKKTGLLDSKPASGVMFVRKGKLPVDFICEPVVWVRDICTFFYETACASGTAAIGIWNSLQVKNQRIILKIQQPSGYILTAEIQIKDSLVQNLYIEGPIEILNKKGFLTL